jgi:hypothetical protein
MFIDRSRSAADMPDPATPDEVASWFAVPLMTLAPQPTIEETSVALSSETGNGRPVLEAAALSYTLWRNPADRDDPLNLLELSPQMRASLDVEPVAPLPQWMIDAVGRIRYPSLWEAVRTTHLSDRSTFHTAESTLVEHVNYILMNNFREERMRGDFPGELDGRVTEKSIEHGVPISVDGTELPGMRIDTDPHVLGLALDLGHSILTVAIAREHLPLLTLAFVTRPAPARR